MWCIEDNPRHTINSPATEQHVIKQPKVGGLGRHSTGLGKLCRARSEGVGTPLHSYGRLRRAHKAQVPTPPALACGPAAWWLLPCGTALDSNPSGNSPNWRLCSPGMCSSTKLNMRKCCGRAVWQSQNNGRAQNSPCFVCALNLGGVDSCECAHAPPPPATCRQVQDLIWL